jgi:hypothetical protein
MNPYAHRPIIFNGIELPAEMMGIDIVERLIPLPESVADWLWRLPICQGVEKSCDAATAREACRLAHSLIAANRERILAGIVSALPAYMPEEVFVLWLSGLETIQASAQLNLICRWHALAEPGDPVVSREDTILLLQRLEQIRHRILEEGSGG